MKAYVLHGINDLRFEEVGKPEIKANEVLVNVKAVGICGSDIPRIFETGTYSFPLIPGHEFAGVVEEVGDEADIKWLNKKVGVFPLIPCKECSSCQNETYEMCSHYNYLGSRCNGGFAEYVAVPVWNLLELPEQFDLRQAAMLEPASVALHAIRRLELKEESTVALLGLGPIGTIMAQWFSYYRVKKVMATGHRAEFGEVMKQTADSGYCFTNAHETDSIRWIKEQTDGLGADIVIDCVNNSESLSNCLECVKPGGQILMVGNPHGDIQVEKKIYWQILRKQVTIKGTWNSSFVHREDDDWHMVIKACEEGKLKLLPLISHEMPFEQLHKGLDVMKEKKEYRNKVMIVR